MTTLKRLKYKGTRVLHQLLVLGFLIGDAIPNGEVDIGLVRLLLHGHIEIQDVGVVIEGFDHLVVLPGVRLHLLLLLQLDTIVEIVPIGFELKTKKNGDECELLVVPLAEEILNVEVGGGSKHLEEAQLISPNDHWYLEHVQ